MPRPIIKPGGPRPPRLRPRALLGPELPPFREPDDVRRKLLPIGRVFNMQPDLVDGITQRYSYSGVPTKRLVEVQVGGVVQRDRDRALLSSLGPGYFDVTFNSAYNVAMSGAQTHILVFVPTAVATASLVDMNGALSGWDVGVDGSDYPYVTMVNDLGTSYTVTGAMKVVENEKYVLAWQYDAAGTLLYASLNGVVMGSKKITNTALTCGAGGFRIGATLSSTNGFTGEIHSYAIFNTALTFAEISDFSYGEVPEGDSRLVAYYRFIGNARDGSPTANNATASGSGVTYPGPDYTHSALEGDFSLRYEPGDKPVRCTVEGWLPLGNARFFNGENARTLDAGDVLDPTSSFTWEAWIWCPASGRQPIVSKWANSTTTGSYFLELQPVSGDMLFELRTTGGNFQATGEADLGAWAHYAITWDGSDLRLLKNALEIDSSATTGTIAGTSASLLFGKHDGNVADGLLMTEVRAWSTARTQEQIAEWMRRPLSGNEANLVGYWHGHDVESGATWYDSTDNENDAAESGSPTDIGYSAWLPGPYPKTAAEVTPWIGAQLAELSENDMDTASFTSFETDVGSAEVGEVFRSETAGEVLSSLVRPDGTWGFDDTTGKLRLVLRKAPESETSEADVIPSKEVEIRRLAVERAASEVNILYRRNAAPLTTDQLSPIMLSDPRRVEELTRAWSEEPHPIDSKLKVPSHRVELETSLVHQKDAAAAAKRVAAQRGKDRELYAIDTKELDLIAGQVVTVDESSLRTPRFAFSGNAKKFQVDGVSIAAEPHETSYTLWG